MLLGDRPLGTVGLGQISRTGGLGAGLPTGGWDGTTVLQPSGPTFTRKRWLELIAEAEAKARGEREAEAFRREAALDAARKAIEKAQAQVRAARAAQQAEWAEQARIRAHAAMLASDQGLAHLQQAGQLANTLAAASRHAHAQQLANEQDDDEALALLLSHR
jgi:hypothetical protein